MNSNTKVLSIEETSGREIDSRQELIADALKELASLKQAAEDGELLSVITVALLKASDPAGNSLITTATTVHVGRHEAVAAGIALTHVLNHLTSRLSPAERAQITEGVARLHLLGHTSTSAN